MSLSAGRPAWQLPLQWPQATAPSGVGDSLLGERLFKAAILFAMLAFTVLDRFGLRVTESTSISTSLMAMYGLAAAMVTAGVAELNVRGAAAYLAVFAIATLSLMVNAAVEPPPLVSAMSFLLLGVIYAPLCVSLRQGAAGPELWRWTVNLFTAFALFVAAAGIAQFFIQFVFHPAWLFDYTPLIPERLRATSGWNTAYLIYASTGEAQWTKSNGFFMREPSIFSVVMAFGLLCELSLARRKWVMAILAMGLVLSYAASGLVCLAAGLLFPLGRNTAARVVAFVVLAAGIFLLFGEALNLSHLYNRVDEFAVKNSSAYCRFVYPTVATFQQIDSHAWTALLGHGPGSMERMGATCHNHEVTYAKALFEYGLVGTLAFGVLVLGALNRSAAPLRIRVGAGVTWVLLGGNLLDPPVLLFIYVVSAMWPKDTARSLKLAAPARGLRGAEAR